MIQIKKCFFIILTALNIFTIAQTDSWIPGKENTELGGYIKEIPIAVIDDSLIWSNILQTRFNTAWYPFNALAFILQGRMVLFSGDQFSVFEPFTKEFEKDPNYLDLTSTWPSVLYGNIDRFYADLSSGIFSARLGRQRINWGICYVWNPNDWFNAFSFYDFSYDERRGTDALRLTLYPTVLSSIEIAASAADRIEKRTIAAMYHFNKFAYDFQIQAGVFGRDLAFGTSWAGQISDAGFRGEISYFHPVFMEDSYSLTDSSGSIVAAISADYTFPSSFYLHSEILYNGFGNNTPLRYNTVLYSTNPSQLITAKNLSPAKMSLFAEIAYNFTPLTNGSFSTIISRFGDTDDYLFFWGPTFQWSVFRNIDLTLSGQIFYETAYSEYNTLIAAEIRWSF